MILVIRVHPHNLAHRLALQAGEQLGRRLGVVNVGGRHQDRQQQAHAIDDDMPLAAVHVLEVVAAPLRTAGGRVDRLAVNAGGGAGVVGLRGRAGLAAERVVDGVQGAVVPPLIEIPPDGAPGRQVNREVAPLAAGAKDVEDGIDDVPHRRLPGPSSGRSGREVRLDQGPLRVGDVAGVVVYSHTTSTSLDPLMFPLWDRL